MSESTINTAEKQVGHGSGGQLVQGFAKRMQWLLEWEKAYLDEQRRQVATGDKAQSGAQADTKVAVLPEKAVVAGDEVCAEQESAKAPHMNRPEPLTSAVSQTPKPSQFGVSGMSLSAAQHTPVLALGMPAVVKPLAGPYGPAAPASTPGYVPGTDQELNPVVIVREQDEARIWIRSAALEPNMGSRLLVQLRHLMAGVGLRLAEVTLNGERLWERSSVSSSVGDREGMNSNQTISEVY